MAEETVESTSRVKKRPFDFLLTRHGQAKSWPKNLPQTPTTSVRVFTHMVSHHHEEALNYKFKHKRANKSLNNVDQWLKQRGSV